MTTSEDPGRALQVLLAKQEITEALARYCRGMDRMDDDLARSVFHPDATADYGEGIYQGTGYGFVDFARASHEAMVTHHHQIGTISIVIDGETAGSECYVRAQLHDSEDEIVLFRSLSDPTVALYLEQCLEAHLRIVDRRVTGEFSPEQLTRDSDPAALPRAEAGPTTS